MITRDRPCGRPPHRSHRGAGIAGGVTSVGRSAVAVRAGRAARSGRGGQPAQPADHRARPRRPGRGRRGRGRCQMGSSTPRFGQSTGVDDTPTPRLRRSPRAASWSDWLSGGPGSRSGATAEAPRPHPGVAGQRAPARPSGPFHVNPRPSTATAGSGGRPGGQRAACSGPDPESVRSRCRGPAMSTGHDTDSTRPCPVDPSTTSMPGPARCRPITSNRASRACSASTPVDRAVDHPLVDRQRRVADPHGRELRLGQRGDGVGGGAHGEQRAAERGCQLRGEVERSAAGFRSVDTDDDRTAARRRHLGRTATDDGDGT